MPITGIRRNDEHKVRRGPGPSIGFADKWKQGTRSRTRYWLVVAVLAVVGAVVLALFGSSRKQGALLPEPSVPKPEYVITEARELPSPGVERLSVVALVRPGTDRDSLRTVLDWMLYSTLDEYNHKRRRFVRVIWAYVLDNMAAAKSSWLAMAIWVDPKLGVARRPARIGGDALRVGPVEYGFTNSVRRE